MALVNVINKLVGMKACLLVVLAFANIASPLSATAEDQTQPGLMGHAPPAGSAWLEQIDLSRTEIGFGRPTVAATVAGNPLSIGGQPYKHGIGSHADSEIILNLKGQALRFMADVGVDDDVQCAAKNAATTNFVEVEFFVWVDGRQAAASGAMHLGDTPVRLDVNLAGAKTLRLELRKAKGSRFSHASWAGAALTMKPSAPLPKAVAANKTQRREIQFASLPAKLSSADEERLKAPQSDANTIWIDELDLGQARFNSGTLWLGGIVSRAPRDKHSLTSKRTTDGMPLRLAGVDYPRGVVSSGETELRVALNGEAKRLVARVGFNTSFSCGKVSSGGDALFEVWVDHHLAARSPRFKGYDRPLDIDVDLTGAKLLVVRSTSEGGPIAWAGAFIEAQTPSAHISAVAAPAPASAFIAKRTPDEVRINGPKVVGASPGRPFLFRIPATGKAPLRFEAHGLPTGLSLDEQTGIVTGAIKTPGTSRVNLQLVAANGRTERVLLIVAGRGKLALAPPMGWNSWNVWGMSVDDAKVRAAADALISSGLAAQGYQYINIDEGWSDGRDAQGNIKASAKFPNMPALAAYVHSKGLHIGIHNSPGPKTCGGMAGSYLHEEQDARTWASWGIDYLKYDWCSYGEVAKDNSLPELQKPYKIMQKELQRNGRDVVYSLCQYGLGDVWNWGRNVGGNLWRTGADIVDTWASLSDLGFTHSGREKHIGPGGWNDPDMMVVGTVGWGPKLHPTRLTANEQITHVTLWSMLASPLLLGNDLSQLDEFTADLISNPEVIDINQDMLGRAASRKTNTGGVEVWARPLHDGTTAVAIFNRSPVATEGVAAWKDVGLKGTQLVRDLWLRKDLGAFKGAIAVSLPAHGAALLRVGAPRR